MKNSAYLSPTTSVLDLEYAQFICVSIQELTFEVEIDEYGNIGEEQLNFDSEY